jgi:uroporphyrinogen-III synthase
MTEHTLDGFVVGVTADRRAEEQIELLARRGASVLHGPVIRTLPLSPDEGLRELTKRIVAEPCDHMVANTGIGMRGWFSAAESWGLEDELLESLRVSRIVCRGPKAAGAVGAAGLTVAWRAPGEELREVIDHLVAEGVGGQRVALQLDGDHQAGDALGRLAAAGADVIPLPVYRWTRPEDARPARRVVEAAASGDVQAVTFTAAPAVHNFFDLTASAGQASELLDGFNSGSVIAACVGPVCARAARARGVVAPLEPRVARLGSLVRALADRLGSTTRELVLAGVPVVLRGTVVDVAGERVALRTQERVLLGELATRPGNVVGHERLLRTVCGDEGANKHALEVAVTRLRARLGAAGVAVRSVPRRGYRLDVD